MAPDGARWIPAGSGHFAENLHGALWPQVAPDSQGLLADLLARETRRKVPQSGTLGIPPD